MIFTPKQFFHFIFHLTLEPESVSIHKGDKANRQSAGQIVQMG